MTKYNLKCFFEYWVHILKFISFFSATELDKEKEKVIMILIIIWLRILSLHPAILF